MNNILIVALIVSGLGFFIVLFKLLKKAGKFAVKFPTVYVVFFLLYGLLGLSGFILENMVADKPVLLGLTLLVVSITGGVVLAHNLYERWEWSKSVTFGRRLLYVGGMLLVALITFIISFVLSEHRGFPTEGLKADIVWWLAGIIPVMALPIFIKWAHDFWNEIPIIERFKPIFRLPISDPPPFIETGGASINFNFLIPLDLGSKEVLKTEVSVPYNLTIAEVFHYKLHEHNVVKRFSKKIVLAHEDQRSKIYDWSFYRPEKIWWGWLIRKNYINPQTKVGADITFNESIFVERVKTWKEK